jgi:tetratricopeptide (TPR) repeat protein
MQARPLIGREAELDELTRALAAARAGRGSLRFLSGEPGIGKSRLAEELSERAAQAGMLVVWGRCWEAGGAPAYWPWIQILRALLRGEDPLRLERELGQRADYLTSLLPELASRSTPRETLPPLDADRGRFELLDALSGALCEIPRPEGVLVILEDLHAADASSLSVFELLGPQLRSSQVCVLGTFRDGDARLSQARDALVAATQQGRVLELARLDRGQVRHFLALSAATSSSGEELSERVSEAVFEATEGNPLFLNEVTRLCVNQRSWEQLATSGVAIPGNLRHTLRRRLDSLSAPTQAALEVASVLGREFSGTLLSALWERSMAETALPLNEALEAGILLEPAPGEYRFSHVLLREVLHQDVADRRRTELHLQAAMLLQRREPEAVLWSEIAHHFLEAGSAGRDGAVDACVRAAQAAESQFGFFDARQWYTRALTALGQDPTADLAGRGALLLQLADAELHSGAIALGKQTCQRAATLARALDDAELLGKAALTFGSVLVFAAVDAELVALLREALAKLEPGDSALRAVLTARLAAAQQPAIDPEPPIAMAREAVAMARRLGDSGIWLETARYAVSAMMDLAKPSERLALNREYIQVAQQLGQRLEVLRGQMRLVFDCFELGDLVNAELAIVAIELLAHKLGHPFYAWRAHSFRAMAAIFQGRFADAEHHMQRARELGSEAQDPNVVRADVMQRFAMLRLQGRYPELLELCSELAESHQGLEHADLLLRLHTSEALSLAGRSAQASALLTPKDVQLILGLTDASLTAPLIRQFGTSGDPALWALARANLERNECRFASGGMTMMVWEEPVVSLLARCAEQAGRIDEARSLFQQAIALAEQAGSPPYAAWNQLELADLLLGTGQSADVALARELLDQAGEVAERLGMPGLSQRVRLSRARSGKTTAEAPSAPAVPPAKPAPAALLLKPEGESWSLYWREREIRLQDSRGVQWLHELLQRPGEEIHVLELVAPGQQLAGDAGELLDAEAISAYRRRLAELPEELAEAEAFNEIGRMARLQQEREFLQRELSRALGLGGRERRAGVAAERARVNVQRRLRHAIQRIAARDPELGLHLERSVTTGVFCRYRP